MGDVFDQIASGQQPNAAPASPQSQSTGDVFDQVAAQQTQQSVPAQPDQSSTDDASQTRQMLVSGLTGMPTPNMSAEDRASFEKGKAAGAISVPVVAASTVGATELGALGADTVNAARQLVQAHPTAAKVIGKMLLTGALGGDVGHSAKTAILGALLGALIK